MGSRFPHLDRSTFIQGDSKKMSPLAFKSNNSRSVHCTTLPNTPFEREDNFLSNGCIHTRFPFQIALPEAANQKLSVFLPVQISSNGKMCFVVPVSHLRKQALHVTARGISHEPPKGKISSGTTFTAVASYPINGSSTSSCWLPCDQSPHCPDYLDHACLRYLKPEA